MKTTVQIVLTLVGVIYLTSFATQQHDKEVIKSAEKFTACVAHQYRMTPSEFIEQYGVNAECK